MSFETDKVTLLDHLETKNCRVTRFIRDSLSYESLFQQLRMFIETFNCTPDDLKEILDLFDDGLLVLYGIHYNKTGDLTDPIFVVGGTLDDIILQTNAGSVYIVGGTTASRILVKDSADIGYILTASGVIVEEIEVEEGSHVRKLDVNTCKTFNTTIQNVRNNDEVPGVDYFFIQPLPATTTVPATTTIAP